MRRHNMAATKGFVTSCFLWLTFITVLEAKDSDCGPSPQEINVTSSGGILYSPGYPEYYQNSLSCSWMLVSSEHGKVLQLRPLDLQVGFPLKRDEPCTGDVITAYDDIRPTADQLMRGQQSRISSPVLHEWCGEDETVVHSTSTSVLLTFRTDRHRRYRGFAIQYSLLMLADSRCERDAVKTIPLQDNHPVTVDFSSPPSPSPSLLHTTCSWRVVADNVRSQVVIDLERFDEGLPCQDGNFSVYDGPETSSPEIIRWCARSTKPFTSVFLSGGQGMVVIRTRPNVTSALRFRFRTRPRVFAQCSLSHLPTIELNGQDPVYISFPFAVNHSGASCPVQMLSAVTWTLWARVDVLLMSGGRQPTCPLPPPSPLHVLQANATGEGHDMAPTAVQPACFRGNKPVFWPIAESVIVGTPAESRGLLLKITPSRDGACHGRLLQLTAPTDETLVIKDPPASVRNLQYSRSAWCRYVVRGQNEADHVVVNVEAELCELKDVCGDFVRLYDGPSSDSALLYDSANRTHVTVHVISSGRHVTFEYGTDDRENRGFIQAEFNSVPEADLCSEVQQMKASRVSQNLSSINYPHYYPVNYMCQYCITSEDPDDVIYIEVLDSDMTFSCSDVVELYDGAEGDVSSEYLGRFCGQDRPRYVSKGPGLCLLFRSDPTRHGRGWLLTYRAARPPLSAVHARDGTTNVASTPSSTTTASAVVALAVLVAVIVVFIVYIVKKKRRQSSASV